MMHYAKYSRNLLIPRRQFADPIRAKPYFDIHCLRWVWLDADGRAVRDPKDIY